MDKVPNNKFLNCPALMSDGRTFTSYKSSCFLNNKLKKQSETKSSYAYRQYLINNANSILSGINNNVLQKNGCKPNCNVGPMPSQTCTFNSITKSCGPVNFGGIGVNNGAVKANPGILNPTGLGFKK